MTAAKRATDTLIILVALLLTWQALYQVVGATALPGPTAGTGLVMLPDLLGGVSLNVGPLTQGLPLGDLKLVDVSQLTSLLCTSPGVSCVGIDAADLLAGAHQLLGANLVASLLNLDLPATLSSLQALLGAGDLNGLLRVERVSDTVLRLVADGFSG